MIRIRNAYYIWTFGQNVYMACKLNRSGIRGDMHMVLLYKEKVNLVIEGTIIDIETIGNFNNNYGDSRRYMNIVNSGLIFPIFSGIKFPI